MLTVKFGTLDQTKRCYFENTPFADKMNCKGCFVLRILVQNGTSFYMFQETNVREIKDNGAFGNFDTDWKRGYDMDIGVS